MKDPNNPLKLRAEREGLTIVRSEVVPSTRRAHEAMEWAREHDGAEALHARLMRGYWTEARDLYDLETLRAAAAGAGLDADDLQGTIEAGTYRARVEASVRDAFAM